MNYLNKKVKIITSLIPLFIIGTMLFANQKPAKAYGPVESARTFTGNFTDGKLFIKESSNLSF